MGDQTNQREKETLHLDRFSPPLKPNEIPHVVSAYVENQVTRFPDRIIEITVFKHNVVVEKSPLPSDTAG